MKKIKKMPIFKEDLEFEVFDTMVKEKLRNDITRQYTLYRDKLQFELGKIKSEKGREEYLNQKYQENQLQYDLNIGLSKENLLSDLDIELNAISFLSENLKGIPLKKSKSYIYDCFHLPGKITYIRFVENAFKYLVDKNLIDRRTTKSSFKSIFNNKKANRKVNWVADISQLYFFINQLIEVTDIKVKKKWVLGSSCFLLKGKVIPKEQFHHQKNPKIGPKTDIIIDVFKGFN